MKPIGVITGASSGIGKAYAFELAKTHDLILIARRKPLLDEISSKLKKSDCKVKIIVADLSNEDDLKHLEKILSSTKVDILINSAGFGDPNPFHEVTADLIHDMIYVHIVATTRLSRAVLTGMIAQERGVIVNVASVSGFSKVNAGNLIYDSSKAYLIRFSELLQQSIDNKNKVKIQVLCPGFTLTGFFDKYKHPRTIPKFLWMQPEDVVKKSLSRLHAEKTVFIPGWHNLLIAKLIGNSLFIPLLKYINRYA